MYEQQFNPYAANIAVVKEYFKRGKVLAMGILYLISAVLSVGVAVIALIGSSDFLSDYMRSSGLHFYAYSSANESVYSLSLIISLTFGLILTVLSAVGFLLMYSGSRKENGSPKAGATLLYVLSIINLVGVILLFAGVLLMLLLIMFAVSMYDGLSGVSASDLTFTYDGLQYSIDPSALRVALIVIAVVAILLMVYILLYAIHRMRFYSSVRKSLTTVELQNKGAKAFGVMSIINAVFAGLSLLSNLISIFAVLSAGVSEAILLSVILLLSAVLNFISFILRASIALGYKKHIDNMKYGYNGVPYEGISEGNYAAPYQQDPYASQQHAYPPQPNPYAPQPNSYQSPAPYAAPVTPPAPKAETPVEDYTDLYSSAPVADSEPETLPEPVDEPVQESAAPAFCTNCGASVTTDSVFCTNCGHKLK